MLSCCCNTRPKPNEGENCPPKPKIEAEGQSQTKLPKKSKSPKKTKEDSGKKSKSNTEKNSKKKTDVTVTLGDFDKLKTLGKGAFGEVFLCRKKSNQNLYAMKKMIKKNISNNQIPRLLAERNLMAFADHDYVVMLDYAFQDDTCLYLVMDFLQGGDLMGLLMEKDVFSIKATKFYIGEISLAVHSIHGLGYCHRDLKPDNILLDKRGHIKLADFGLAKKLTSKPLKRKNKRKDGPGIKSGDSKINPEASSRKGQAWKDQKKLLAHSMVGTPDYMAPEIFTHDGYDDKCDWWGVGCIMFECLAGFAPFYSNKNIEHTVHSIINWEQRLSYADINDRVAVAFLKTVLCEVEDRSTFPGIMKHKLFNGFDWDNVHSLTAPYHNHELEDELDTRYFYYDPEDEDEDSSRGKVVPESNQIHKLQDFAFNIDVGDDDSHCPSDLWIHKD